MPLSAPMMAGGPRNTVFWLQLFYSFQIGWQYYVRSEIDMNNLSTIITKSAAMINSKTHVRPYQHGVCVALTVSQVTE